MNWQVEVKANNMEQTSHDIANEILLTRDRDEGPILLLEGDNDVKFFRRFVKNPDMSIIATWGKENLLDAVEILEAYNGIQGFMGIVDADFGHIDGSLPNSRNVIVTDDHDVEMMIVRTKAFDAVLYELGSARKIREFPNREGRIRDALMQRALIIGHLRYLSVADDLRLRFEGLRFDHFIDRDSLEIDRDRMLNNVLALTGNQGLDAREIRDRLLELVEDMNDDPHQICCGHDFIAIFGIALRKVLGSKSHQAASLQALGTALRLAYDSEDFYRTQLYADARFWSKRNIGYDIFRSLPASPESGQSSER